MTVIPCQSNSLRYCIINDYYTSEELADVMRELDQLEHQGFRAEDSSGSFNRSGSSVWLDQHYNQRREESSILTHSRKIFLPSLVKTLAEFDNTFNHLKYVNEDFTLINYYDTDDEYASHSDTAALSAVTFLARGEFTGGEFTFPEYNVIIPFEHNSMVIFPSCTQHCSRPIKSDTPGARVSIAQFLNYRPSLLQPLSTKK